jgi:hypothetical protein
MMAAIVRQFVPGEAAGEKRCLAHMAGRLGAADDDGGMGHMPDAAVPHAAFPMCSVQSQFGHAEERPSSRIAMASHSKRGIFT